MVFTKEAERWIWNWLNSDDGVFSWKQTGGTLDLAGITGDEVQELELASVHTLEICDP